MNKPTNYAEQTDRIRALTTLLDLTTISGDLHKLAEAQVTLILNIGQPAVIPAAASGDTVVTGNPDNVGEIVTP